MALIETSPRRQLTLRLSEQQAAELKRIAQEEHRTLNGTVRYALDRLFEQREQARSQP